MRSKKLNIGYDNFFDKTFLEAQDAINPTLIPLDFIGTIQLFTIKIGRRVVITYAKKGIHKQIIKRGWTHKSIQKTIKNPHKKIKTKDIRRSKDGSRKNDPATAYINKDSSYVVRNDKTGDIVQVSDKIKSNWKPFFKIGE